MVAPQSKPLRSARTLPAFGCDSSPETHFGPDGEKAALPSENLDPSPAASSLERPAIARLEQLIAAGEQRLDSILTSITDTAQQLTGASGAALAMWKDGAMICRARSGDITPVLGARLSAETGISGECLRTGKIQHCADTENDPLVDVEVCRRLGLRALSVLPIRGWRGINGVLEVFSTRAGPFTERHIVLLESLASLAERARATQPHSASAAMPKPFSTFEVKNKRSRSRLLPASDRVADVALAFLGPRWRPVVVGAMGLAATLLIVLVIWLGWRGPDGMIETLRH